MPKKLILKWSMNNAKLKKLETASFNLPAFRSESGFEVCPQAGGCATLCYARQGRYVIKSVRDVREFNLAHARGDQGQFKANLTSDLKNIKQRVIRLHDSGDFFSQTYLDTWCEVMSAFPEKRFYAYTKSLHLDWTRTPPNFQRIQSMGGKMDAHIDVSRSHARIFSSTAERLAAGYADGNKNDGPAIAGIQKIGLVYHGTKHLKRGQIIWLGKTG